MSELQPYYTGFWVKTPSSSWTSVGGAISVVPFLEATLLETHLSPGHFWFFSHGRLRPVVVTSPFDKLNGCC